MSEYLLWISVVVVVVVVGGGVCDWIVA